MKPRFLICGSRYYLKTHDGRTRVRKRDGDGTKLQVYIEQHEHPTVSFIVCGTISNVSSNSRCCKQIQLSFALELFF